MLLCSNIGISEMSWRKVSCRFVVCLCKKHLGNIYCLCRGRMSQREQEPSFSQSLALVKLVHTGVWCSLRCCCFSGNLSLANFSVVMSSCLIAYLLLSRKADSWGFRAKETFVDFLLLFCKGNAAHGKSWYYKEPGQDATDVFDQWWRFFYIIINHFLASGKCNMLHIFILNVIS